MSGPQALTALAAALLGAVVALLWVRVALAAAPPELVRTNVAGKSVPAVLGLPLGMGALVGLGLTYTLERTTELDPTSTRLALAVLVVVVLCALAGYADDRRGDEHERGFTGHLRAAARGRLTGGIVKIAGVGVAGLAAGALLRGDWFTIECAALIALGANLINLMDRAPGRAGKVALLGALPLGLFGAGAWTTAAAGLLGALAVCLGPDLAERGMLGDAGANPLGGVLGLGLAVSCDRPGRLVALGLLAVLNLASERWSFSRGIERVGPLRALDRLGRRAPPEVDSSTRSE